MKYRRNENLRIAGLGWEKSSSSLAAADEGSKLKTLKLAPAQIFGVPSIKIRFGESSVQWLHLSFEGLEKLLI